MKLLDWISGWTDGWENKINNEDNVINDVLCLFTTVFLSNEHRDCSPTSHYTHMKAGHFVPRFLYLRFPPCLRIERPICTCRWWDMNRCHFWRANQLCVAVHLLIYLCVSLYSYSPGPREVGNAVRQSLTFLFPICLPPTVHYSLQRKLESHIPLFISSVYGTL